MRKSINQITDKYLLFEPHFLAAYLKQKKITRTVFNDDVLETIKNYVKTRKKSAQVVSIKIKANKTEYKKRMEWDSRTRARVAI